MTKAPLYLLLVISFLSCQTRETNKNVSRLSYFDSIQERNITFLDTTHLLRYNDSAKWRLYTIFCDDSCSFGTVHFNKKYFEKTPMSFLDLKLTYIDKANDTLSLLYDIFYKDSINVSKKLTNKYISDGVIYDAKSDTLIGYVAGEGIMKVRGTNSRFINPLEPSVVNFLKENQAKLNPWLYQEANKRRVIP